MEILKYLIPFISFAVGVFMSPWVESRKRKADLRYKLKLLFFEISHLKNDSESMIDIAYQTYSKLFLIEHLGVNSDIQRIYSTPRVIRIQVLDKLLLEVYPLLTYAQRDAIKSIFEISGSINEELEKLEKPNAVNAVNAGDLDRGAIRSIVHSTAILIYLTSRLHDEREHFTGIKGLDDEEVISKTLQAYNCSLEALDIIQKYEEAKIREKPQANRATEGV